MHVCWQSLIVAAHIIPDGVHLPPSKSCHGLWIARGGCGGASSAKTGDMMMDSRDDDTYLRRTTMTIDVVCNCLCFRYIEATSRGAGPREHHGT